MELNIEKKQQLEQLLAKPGSATQEDIPFLQQLIKTFPCYQPLHLLLAKASSNSENKHSTFTKAALYTNGGILHRIIHEPQQLTAIEELEVIHYQPWTNVRFEIAKNEPEEEVIETVINSAPIIADAPEIENLAPLANEVIAVEATEEPEVPQEEEVETIPHSAPIISEVPEIENLAPLAKEVIAVEATEEPEVPQEEETETIPDSAPIISEVPEIETLAPLANEAIAVEATEEPEAPQEKVETTPHSAPAIADAPEIENLEPLANEVIKVCKPEAAVTETEATTLEADEQEIFEEITELVTPKEEILAKDVEPFIETEEQEAPVEETEISEENLVMETKQVEAAVYEVEEAKEDETIEETEDGEEATNQELEIEAIAATNFFAFDRNFSSERIVEEDETSTDTQEIAEEPIVNAIPPQENTVSKYDDDKLPFTFLWWLAKTRKDHEQIFRPFASPVKANAQPLQQQYIEHIFHIQAPLEPIEAEQSAVPVQATKGSEIIDNFIKNDPQLKALKPDQINNENKAKRSAEDSNDLVSETLAQIYIEQMLYHKAIDTYQKLSLKFPEKSGYFADLIQSLEKKI